MKHWFADHFGVLGEDLQLEDDQDSEGGLVSTKKRMDNDTANELPLSLSISD